MAFAKQANWTPYLWAGTYRDKFSSSEHFIRKNLYPELKCQKPLFQALDSTKVFWFQTKRTGGNLRVSIFEPGTFRVLNYDLPTRLSDPIGSNLFGILIYWPIRFLYQYFHPGVYTVLTDCIVLVSEETVS